MAGTKAGGLKASETNKQRYGKDFYTTIGSKGGKAGHTGGFAYGNNGAKYGAMGGRLSRRGRVVNLGDELTPNEVIMLTAMATEILDDLHREGKMTQVQRDIEISNIYTKHYLSNWQILFTTWGCEDISIRWYKVLQSKVKEFHGLIKKGELAEIDNDEYRALRNLCNAYKAATGRAISVANK